MPRTTGSRNWRATEGREREVVDRDTGETVRLSETRTKRKRDDLLMMPYARVNMSAFMQATRNLSPVGHDIISMMMQRTDRNTYQVSGVTVKSVVEALGVHSDTVNEQLKLLRESELLTYYAKGRRWSWDARVVQHGVIDMDDVDDGEVPMPDAR